MAARRGDTGVVLRAGSLPHPDGSMQPGDVVLDGNLIGAPGPRSVANTAVIDVSGLTVSPGWIDLQVNGAAGHDLTLDPSLVWDVGEWLATVGVTRWLPTLVSGSPDLMRQASAVLASGAPAGWRGAMPIGWHFEGPWLQPARRGAHPLAALLAPPAGLDAARAAAVVTLAPELTGGGEFIAQLAASGVVVSIGHSQASAAETKSAIDQGASMGTHLFNAMSGLHHRDPGVAAALLTDDRVVVGLIADGHHVHDDMMRLAWSLAGSRIALVSDSMAAAGLGAGTASLGNQRVTIADGTARLADGTLAGSVISLRDAIEHCTDHNICSLATALRAGSTTPARALGRRDVGTLEPRTRADVTVLGPDLTIEATIVDGDLIFASDAFAARWEAPWKS